jgi:hypothetical protein
MSVLFVAGIQVDFSGAAEQEAAQDGGASGRQAGRAVLAGAAQRDRQLRGADFGVARGVRQGHQEVEGQRCRLQSRHSGPSGASIIAAFFIIV